MRKLLCLALLAACELQPPPKQQPAPPPATRQPQAGSAAAGSAGTTPARPTIEISAPCLDVATKIVQVFVDNATDAGQKSVYEQARTTMVRKTGEACTQQAWSEEARACYSAAKTPADIKACETRYTPPPSAPPAAQPATGEPR